MKFENAQIEDAEIHISNLRLRTFIGFNPEELEKKQDVVINASLAYALGSECETDDENEALDYKLITKAIIQLVESGRFKLLEKLTADVVGLIMENGRVNATHVRIEKPHALRFSDSVSISLSAKR